MAGKFVLKKSSNDKFYFNLLADNGENILKSEMYEAHASAIKGIESVKTNASNDARYERKTAKSGGEIFNLKAANGMVIGTSEAYTSDYARETAIDSVKTNALRAPIDDQTNEINDDQPSPILDEADAFHQFQVCTMRTAISPEHALLCVAVNLGGGHNQHHPELSSIFEEHDSVENMRDMLALLTADTDLEIQQVLDMVYNQGSIVYFGSLHTAGEKQLSKLPGAIVAYSKMSHRQFRVGLFRMGITLVVICLVSGSSFTIAASLTRMALAAASNLVLPTK